MYNPRFTFGDEVYFVVVALTARRVELVLNLDARRGTEQTQLATMTALARTAIGRIEAMFPGNDKPPRERPPVPVCSLLTEADFHELRPPSGTPAPAVDVFEVQYFGGNNRIGAGPVGGGWLCDSFNKAGYPAWWLSKKAPPRSALLAGGEPVAGIGNAAVWLRRPGWWLESDVTLSILTTGGHHLEIEVEGDDDVASRRRVAVAAARKALTRLP
jgi:hypothetical protein